LRYDVVIVAVASEEQLIAPLTSVGPDVVFNTSEHLRANPGFSPASRCDMWTWGDYVAAIDAIVTNAALRA